MIRRLELPENLREQFDPSVQDLYQELWDEVRDSPENEP
jgi:cation transport regulator ChaB